MTAEYSKFYKIKMFFTHFWQWLIEFGRRTECFLLHRKYRRYVHSDTKAFPQYVCVLCGRWWRRGPTPIAAEAASVADSEGRVQAQTDREDKERNERL